MDDVHRDRAWVEREYGTEKWPLIRDALAGAPDDVPARTLAAVHRAQWPDVGLLAPREGVIDGRRVRLPHQVLLGAFSGLVVGAVLDACRPDTGLVLELGSGWGRNLVQVWLEGGPADAEYVAAEYTAAGREATEQLARRFAEQQLRAVPFDYHAPDLTALRRECGHAVVFSVHSLEQIPHVAPDLVGEIAALAPEVTVVHVEPVGWQLPGAGDRQGTSAEHARRHDYNRDLVEVLRAAEAAGRIAIGQTLPEVVGLNPDNASSVVVWSAGGADGR
jgi:hypothetical protein